MFESRAGSRRCLGDQTAPCLFKSHGKAWGGRSPPPFPVGFEEAGGHLDFTSQRFQARFLKVRDFGFLGTPTGLGEMNSATRKDLAHLAT
jgi:hypothetical protein